MNSPNIVTSTLIPFYGLVLLIPISIVWTYNRSGDWHIVLAVFLSVLIGYIDSHSSEVIFPIVLLFAFGYFLGFAKPDRFLVLGIVLAIGVPLFQLYQSLVVSDDVSVKNLGTLISLVPSFAGIGIGVGIRRLRADDNEGAHA